MLEEEESAFDIQQLWTLFKANWKWFPLSMVVCVLIAGLYLWFTPSTVTVTGKMEIIDKSKKGSGGLSAGLAMLNSLPLGLGSSLGGVSTQRKRLSCLTPSWAMSSKTWDFTPNIA